MSSLSVEELVERIQNGEENLKGDLYDAIKRLLYMYCKPYYRIYEKHGYTWEDLISVSWFGVEKALKFYQNDKGAKFTTYLEYHIKRPISAFLGFKKDDPFVLSLDAPITGTDDITLGDAVSDTESTVPFEEIEKAVAYKEMTEIALQRIPEAHAEILRMYFLENMTLQQIADEKGVSFSYASQLKSNALKKIKAVPELRQFRADEWGGAYRHVGVRKFNTTWTSSTEQAIFDIERERREWEKQREE